MDELNLAPPKHIDVAVPANMHCGILHQHEDGWAPIARTDDEVPEVTVDWVRSAPADIRRMVGLPPSPPPATVSASEPSAR